MRRDPNTAFLSSQLVVACHRGRADRVRRLLDLGVDAGAASYGTTPLQAAALFDRTEVIEMLQAAGARSDLLAAALMGDEPMVRRLLAGGADPDSRTDGALTVLMWTSIKGHAGVVRA